MSVLNRTFFFSVVIAMLSIFASCENNSSTTTETTNTNTPPKGFVPLDSVPCCTSDDKINPPLIVQTEDLLSLLPMKMIGERCHGYVLFQKNWYNGAIQIEVKDFQGSSPYDVPLLAHIVGNIKEIEIENQKFEPNGQAEFFFRCKMKLFGGYNRIPFTVRSNDGTSSDGFLEITVQEK